MKKVVFKGIAASLVLSLSLAGCGSGSPAPSAAPSSSPESQSETTPVVVKLGVVGESNEWWDPAIAALKEEGIKIELVKFSDYTLPNQALADRSRIRDMT